jgi:hypothetical protein
VGAEVIPARESSLDTRARSGCAPTDVLTIALGSTGLGASGNITAEAWKRRTAAASKLVTPPLCHGWPRPTMKRMAQKFDSTSGRYYVDSTRVNERFGVQKERVLLRAFSACSNRAEIDALAGT